MTWFKFRKHKLQGPETIMGLGYLAGGIAGKAAFGDPGSIGADTSVPGVTKAVIQPATKMNLEHSVPQVDPSGAINSYMQGAATSADYIKQGLNLYNASIASAAKSLNTGYIAANATLTPTAIAAQQAMNKQLQMLGMNPISRTASYNNILSDIGEYPELQAQLTAAENLKDPIQRANAKQQILSQVSNMKTLPNGFVDVQLANLTKPTLGTPTVAQYTKYGFLNEDYVTQQGQLQAKFQKDTTDYNAQVAKIKQDALNEQQTKLNGFANQYNTNYDANLGTAFTGEQVQNEIANTPGYQFQMNQGNQAIQRAASATGNLSSGNTLTALTKFGQGLASNYYDKYMANLQNISTSGMGAVGAMATNQVNQGKDLANLSTIAGAANAAAYNVLGTVYGDAYNNKGATTLSAAQNNVAIQNQAIAERYGSKENQANAALQAAPGLMNAQTMQNQFQYSVFNGQQQGQVQMQANLQAGGQVSQGAGTGYPYYNTKTERWSI